MSSKASVQQSGGAIDPRVRQFHSRRFSLRTGEAPDLLRASGDSGFVAHLTACTHGATGWDWSFRLVKGGGEWAFISDGRLSVFVDEPGQYVPSDAKAGDQVALRLPRARENLHPHRFTLNGGQGPVVVGQSFTKFFLSVPYTAASALVETFASKLGDQLRFSLAVSNSPLDFEKADAAVLDVGVNDLGGVIKVLEAFVAAHPKVVVARGQPHGTVRGPLGLPTATGSSRADVADGFGWKRAAEAVAAGQT
jgi:hypothetical protein